MIPRAYGLGTDYDSAYFRNSGVREIIGDFGASARAARVGTWLALATGPRANPLWHGLCSYERDLVTIGPMNHTLYPEDTRQLAPLGGAPLRC